MQVTSVSYQVEVFACLAEEEALHAILFGFLYNVVKSGIPTPAQVTTHFETHTSKPVWSSSEELRKFPPDFGIFFKALENIHADMQIERVFGRL